MSKLVDRIPQLLPRTCDQLTKSGNLMEKKKKGGSIVTAYVCKAMTEKKSSEAFLANDKEAFEVLSPRIFLQRLNAEL